MKPAVQFLGAAVSAFALCWSLRGQSASSSGNNGTPNLSATPQASVSLGLKWNESTRVFDVQVPNSAGQAAKVLGVQTTVGLYLADFPTAIPANGSAAFSLIYSSRPATDGTADLLRVLTDQGEIVVEVDHNRDSAAVLDQSSLEWAMGSAATAKTVTLLMVPGTTTPTGVTALGSWLQATLQPGSDKKHYSITITPTSTVKPQQGAVIVQFDPALPGVVMIISCSVVAPS